MGEEGPEHFVFTVMSAQAASVEFHINNRCKGRLLEQGVGREPENPEEGIQEDCYDQSGEQDQGDPGFYLAVDGDHPDSSHEQVASHHEPAPERVQEFYSLDLARNHHQEKTQG